MKKVWCPMCKDFVEYEEETVMESFSTTTWAGKKRMGKYHKIYAHCPVCKTVINVPSVVDENTKRRIDAIYESDKEAR